MSPTVSTIDYKALAERIREHADLHDSFTVGAPDSDAINRQRQWAADLRTVVSLLEGMAEEKPFAWAIRDGFGPTRFSVDPDTPILGMRRADHVVDALYLRPAPQPRPDLPPALVATMREMADERPERQPVSELTRWKVGNELAPYHPDASHVEPGYRDGWNACYRAMRESEPAPGSRSPCAK